MSIPTTPPSGFRDFLPEQVAARQKAIETITRVYRSFGFSPIATSAVEELAVLLGKGGGENEKLIFKILKRGDKLAQMIFGEAKDAADLTDMGLRFDLTLPLARYYSKYGSTLPHPFKALSLGPVWRAERAQKGRYREFTQCDVDIIGADSWGAEVEVITAILAVFKTLGVESVKVHLNDRSYVYEALDHAGIPAEKRVGTCVIIDKLDKVPREKVLVELTELVGNDSLSKLQQTLLSATPNRGVGHDGKMVGAEAFAKLDMIAAAVSAATGPDVIRLDPSLMRGFDYYTGPVFEFRHASLSGSLGGGGRYDKLTANFGGPPAPACGGSIGFERLMLLLDEMGRHGDRGAPDAVMTVFSDELRGRALEVAAALRARGLSVDVFPGAGKLKHQFKYADQKKAGYALVIGPDEAARGVVQVKDLKTGDETALSVEEACAKIAARA